MFYELKDSLDLPYVGQKGDIAIVDDGCFKRAYHWWDGCWRHNDGYLSPVKANDLYNEPNV